MFQKILVALDGSDMGRPVFDQALALAKSTQATVFLLHVMSPLDAGYATPLYLDAGAVYPTLYEESMKVQMQEWESLKQQGLEYLQVCRERTTADRVPVDCRQAIGDPGRQICDVAVEWGADLIVVGRRGHVGLGEFLLGSVSNYVMHHAPCSVLTVQGESSVEVSSPSAVRQMSLQ